MTAKLIDGKALAAKIRADMKVKVAQLEAEHGYRPGLAVVLVGVKKPASARLKSVFRKAPPRKTSLTSCAA